MSDESTEQRADFEKALRNIAVDDEAFKILGEELLAAVLDNIRHTLKIKSDNEVHPSGRFVTDLFDVPLRRDLTSDGLITIRDTMRARIVEILRLNAKTLAGARAGSVEVYIDRVTEESGWALFIPVLEAQ